MRIKISEVFNNIEESATLAINQNIKSMRADGEKIYHLGFGESPFPVMQSVKEGLKKGGPVKAYQSTQGLIDLREKVSSFYKHWFRLDYSPENIFIGPGSKELIFDLMLLIEGDLILPVPSWVSYIPQAKIAGKNIIKVETKLTNNYCITAEELEESYIKAKKDGYDPTLMLINTPGNPCGNAYPEAIVKEIAEFAKKNNILIISDEIYANVIFKGYKHTSFAKFYPEGTFITGGISKDRSLGGYRLGTCLIPIGQKEFRKAFNTLISETFSCVSAPIQYAAIEAYSTNNEMVEFINKSSKVHNIALNYFYKKLISSNKIECSCPMGAFYLYPKFNLSKIKSSPELTKILLEKYKVATLPGNCFGQSIDKLNLRLAVTDYCGEEALARFTENPEISENEFIEKYCPNLVKSSDIILKMVKDYA